MARAALVRVVLLVVAIAPVMRVTCDVSCLHIPEPAPPPCHSPATDPSGSDCSHDHGRIVALASPSIALDAAILPAPVASTIAPPLIAIHVAGESIPLVPRASPPTVLPV